MNNKTQKKYLKTTIILNVVSLVFIAVIIRCFFKFINMNSIDNNFYYNLITLSATLSGFLFTGVSILISVIDKKGIKEYWENHYLDALTICSFFGIIVFIVVIFISLSTILFVFDDKVYQLILKIQISLVWSGLTNFLYAIKELLFVIKKLKKQTV